MCHALWSISSSALPEVITAKLSLLLLLLLNLLLLVVVVVVVFVFVVVVVVVVVMPLCSPYAAAAAVISVLFQAFKSFLVLVMFYPTAQASP